MNSEDRRALSVGTSVRLVLLPLLLGLLAFLRQADASNPASGLHSSHQSKMSLAFLVDDLAVEDYQGCDAMTVFDISSQKAQYFGDQHISPGQLALAPDGSMAVAAAFNGGIFTYILRRSPFGEWTTTKLDDTRRPPRILRGGASAITPDGRSLLLPIDSGIERYLLSSITDTSLGPIVGVALTANATAMEVSPNSRVAYVVGIDSKVYTVDIASMQAFGEPIPIDFPSLREAVKQRRMFATISPDSRFLVVNTLAGNINVIDLVNRRNSVISLPGLSQSWGVRFNHAPGHEGLLAVHGRNKIGVYEFTGAQIPILLASTSIPAMDPLISRANALSWTAEGDQLIVAIQHSGLDWRLLDFEAAPSSRLETAYDFNSCTYDGATEGYLGSKSIDVRTLNGPGYYPTPTPPVTVPPTSSPTATWTETPTSTLPPSLTPEPSPSTSDTPTMVLTTIPMLVPVLLPVVLWENCNPAKQQMDMVLIIDASSSMTGAKLSAAKDAAVTFLEAVSLPNDQVGVVAFNEEATTVSELSGDRSVIEAAILGIASQPGTRIDRGLQRASEVLRIGARGGVHPMVTILLTDGRQTEDPEQAQAEAHDLRDRGVRIYTIGLGQDVDAAFLREIAGAPSRYFFAPDESELTHIYEQIAATIPCPPEDFWGGR